MEIALDSHNGGYAIFSSRFQGICQLTATVLFLHGEAENGLIAAVGIDE